MKIADLAPILLTRMEVLDANNNPTGVFFTGHTPVSAEFKEANRKYFPPSKSTSMYVSKKGENRIEIPNDPKNADKQLKRNAEIVTNVEGLDDFDIGKDKVIDLFNHPAMAKAVEQWQEHLDDEKKHSAPPGPSAKRTSKTSAG